MDGVPANWQIQAANQQKAYKRFLEKADLRKTLRVLPDLHEKAFAKIDCLQCANCCKNYSPRFKSPDIKRIAKHLKIKETDFREKYLQLDSDGDEVLKSKPCPFLESDNTCAIYDVRPSDCSRFPYTDEDVLLKRKNLTLMNATVCPAVFEVMEQLLKI